MLDQAATALGRKAEIATDTCTQYLEVLDLVERLHRLSLDVIRGELRHFGLGEITAVQALLLFRIGHRELTASELAQRCCYHGTNISYSLNKLIQAGFLHQRPNAADGRSVLVSLAGRGRNVRDVIAALFERHADGLDGCGHFANDRLDVLVASLRRLERFWVEQRLSGRMAHRTEPWT